jgi:hypothetical protein
MARQGRRISQRPCLLGKGSRAANAGRAGLTPALTVIIADIYDPAGLLEIEVIAAK